MIISETNVPSRIIKYLESAIMFDYKEELYVPHEKKEILKTILSTLINKTSKVNVYKGLFV